MVALFVILTVIVCLGVDSIIQWRKARKEAGEAALSKAPGYVFNDLSVPAGVYLDQGHTWVEVESDGAAHVGVDRFAGSLLGRIDSVELPEVGREVHRGEPLFTLRQGSRQAEFLSPIDGIVGSIGTAVARHPDSILADPYRAGWICRLVPKNLSRSLKELRVAEEARDWLANEALRFQEFFATRSLAPTALGTLMQDGGQPTGGVLELMDDDSWKAFSNDFLHRMVHQ